MKNLLNTLLLVLLLASFSACKSDLDSDIDGNHRSKKEKKEQILKTIRMSFGGDFISESEEPLLRAEDGETYTAINVWRSEKKDDSTFGEEERYAYGLFKGIDDISIDVVTGYVYRFEATILIEREDKIYLNPDFDAPFVATNDEDFKDNPDQGYSKEDLGDFIYTYLELQDGSDKAIINEDRKLFRLLKSGYALVDTGDDGDVSAYRNPRVKRFYGTSNLFDPAISESVTLQMDYKCFGLKIQVESLPGGSLTVRDITDYPTTNPLKIELKKDKLVFPKKLTFNANEGSNVWEGVFSMNSLLSDSETFNLEFIWNKGEGASERFPCSIIVHPKMKKVLILNVSGNINEQKTGNISFAMDSVGLTDEENQQVDYDSTK